MGDALRLSVYLGERDRGERGLLAAELMDLCEREGVAASILLRGVEGFGLRHGMLSGDLLTLSEDLPLVAIALDVPERIERLLERMREVAHRGVITLERARTGRGSPPFDQTKLTSFVGRSERVGRRPAHQVAVECLHRHGLDAANVLLGLDGTFGGRRRRARFLSRNADVPLMVLGVGKGQAVAAAAEELAELFDGREPIFERIGVCKRDGVLLKRPDQPPSTDERGRPYWQKLVVYAPEDARFGHEPLHRALVRRLRREGAAGATTLRAQWGWHGEGHPGGERLLAARRRTPALTVLFDEPARIARWFEVVDEMTRTTGLVTSELVPALRAGAPRESRGGLGLAAPAEG